jgi:hypothetical protein
MLEERRKKKEERRKKKEERRKLVGWVSDSVTHHCYKCVSIT